MFFQQPFFTNIFLHCLENTLHRNAIFYANGYIKGVIPLRESLFLKPVFHEKIWGGRHLATDFGYQIPEGTIGECWAISGHPHGPNIITNGQYKGQLLPKVYQQYPELFGNPSSSVFPLLTKILDANASLSIQVHPNDAYAEKHEHELGKTECWYVIHAEPGAYLTYGHTAKTRAELIKMIDNHQWAKLFSKTLSMCQVELSML